MSDCNPQASTRIMTLDPSAKIIDHYACEGLRQRYAYGEYQSTVPKEQFIADTVGLLSKEKNIPDYMMSDLAESYYDAMRLCPGNLGYREASNRAYNSVMDDVSELRRSGLLSLEQAHSIKNAFGNASLRFDSSQWTTTAGHKGGGSLDLGVVAAMYGYDAINASGHGKTNSYTVVLNRTKVILSEQRFDVSH